MPEDLEPVVALALGSTHTCAIDVHGALRCWGDNSFGQSRVQPALADVVALVVSIAAGSYHTCALHGAGTVTCWGVTTLGEPFDVSLDLGAIAITASADYACALDGDGDVTCFGRNQYGIFPFKR